MPLTSLTYYFFIILVLCLLFVTPKSQRWLILLAASINFYLNSLVEPTYLLVPTILILSSFLLGQKIEKAKKFRRNFFFYLGIAIPLSVLILFKSSEISSSGFENNNFNLIVPLGLSFYIFQILSYLIEINNKKIKAEVSIAKYTMFVLFFANVSAGPIQRPQNFLPQIKGSGFFKKQNLVDGLQLILWGLFKKIVIANRLSLLTGTIYQNPTAYIGIPLILAVVAFAYQLYCDFSGYSDIAIGSAKIFGINLGANFNRPYSSTSLTEFWRRWHISLSSWIHDYVFLPISFSLRNLSKLGVTLSILIAFTLIGLWHGLSSTFVFFGFMNALFLIIEYLTRKIRKKILPKTGLMNYFGIVYTFTFWSMSLIFFKVVSIGDGFYILSHLFSGLDVFLISLVNRDFQTAISSALQKGIGITFFELVTAFIFIFSMELIQKQQKELNFSEWINKINSKKRYSILYFLILALVLFGKFETNQFIYFQF